MHNVFIYIYFLKNKFVAFILIFLWFLLYFLFREFCFRFWLYHELVSQPHVMACALHERVQQPNPLPPLPDEPRDSRRLISCTLLPYLLLKSKVKPFCEGNVHI